MNKDQIVYAICGSILILFGLGQIVIGKVMVRKGGTTREPYSGYGKGYITKEDNPFFFWFIPLLWIVFGLVAFWFGFGPGS